VGDAAQSTERKPSLVRSRVGWSSLAIGAAYAVFTIVLHARSGFPVNATFGQYKSDWFDYQDIARAGAFSHGFWAGSKPPGYPLVIKLLGRDELVHWSMVTLSIVAWLALAAAVAALVRSRGIAFVAAAVVLGFSLTERVQVWNDLAGSETLSISLLVLALAGALAVVNPRLREMAWLRTTSWVVLGAAVTWWCFTRDSNIFVVLLAAIVLAAVAIVRRNPTAALVAVGAVAVGISALVASNVADRWLDPYYNIVLDRVLPDAQLSAAWRDAGMPDTPELRLHQGQITAADNGAILTDPALAPFRAWVEHDGRRTYLEALATRPGLSIRQPLEDFDELFTGSVAAYGVIGGPSYAGSPLDPVTNVLFDPGTVVFVVWLLVVVAAAIWLLGWRRRNPNRAAIWLATAVLVLGFLHSWFVFLGDAHNIGRHAITASVQVRLGGWVLFVLALDELIGARRERLAVTT
jgi:cell division protein FtsL